MPSPPRWPSVAVLCGLAACAGGATDELAGQPGLLDDVKGYYDRYAVEEGGLCNSPKFGLVTGSSIEQQSPDRLIVRVSYLYSDPGRRTTYQEQAAATGQLGIAGPSQCRGFGRRDFTVVRGADGFEVLEMTGPQHRGIKINKIDDSKVW